MLFLSTVFLSSGVIVPVSTILWLSLCNRFPSWSVIIIATLPSGRFSFLVSQRFCVIVWFIKCFFLTIIWLVFLSFL